MTIKNVSTSATAHTATAEAVPAPKLEQIRSGASLLRQGMQGDSIRALQTQLVERKLLEPKDVDGAFGKKTLAAVKQFQQQQKLVRDGLVGPLTLGALEKKGWGASAGAAVPAQRSGFQAGRATSGEASPSTPRAQGLAADASAAQAAVRQASLQGPTSATAVSTPAAVSQPVSSGPVTADAALASLPSGTRAELQLVLDGRAGSTSQAALSGLMASPTYQQLSPIGRRLMLEAVQPSNVLGSLSNLNELLQTPAFGKASQADLEKLISVSKAGQTGALVALGEKLFTKDSQGTRLLDSAALLATGPLRPELAADRQGLLGSALAELANPDLILQKDRNTCSATTATQILARSNPAEVLRLLAGLASPAGAVKLAGGDTMTRAPGTEHADGSGRSASQRLLQAAMMDYGNGAASYDNAKDLSVQKGATHMGLSHEEMAKLMTGLTGKRQVPKSVYQASGLLSYLGSVGRVTANLLGTEGGSLHRTGTDIFAGLAQRSGQDTMAVMHWGTYGHVVSVDRVAEGRVFFRNPQGNQLPAGAAYADGGPPRRSEGGIEQSMAVNDFRQVLMATVAAP